MAKNITMPKLGDMEEGVIANWLKQEGDAVKKGEAIAEIETDKTTVEFEAFETGTLLKIMVPAGGKAPVGGVIGVIGQPGENIGGTSAAPAAAPASAPASAPAAAPSTPAAPTPAPEAAVPTAATLEAEAASDNGRIIATPIAKRIAEERGIDLRSVKGSGPEGRIVKADVENYVAPAKAAPAATPAPATTPAPAAAPSPAATPAATTAADAKIAEIAAAAAGGTSAGAGERVPLTRMRQIIAKRMVESKQQVPHFYVDIGVEMDAALALRLHRVLLV